MTGPRDPTAAAAAPAVTVLVPCRNEAAHIAECLDSLIGADQGADATELLVVDGMSDDGTRDVVREYARRHPAIRLLDNPRRITPTALNIGIRAARGRVIVRADAHVLYPPNYVRRLVAALDEWQADNVGGVLATIPNGDGPMARAIAVAMAHPFGVGNSYFRIGAPRPRWVDTIAFFCCRRETFDRVGLFDEDLLRAQDAEFNARLVAHGGRILLLPDVVAHYYARATLGQVARMFHQYGYFKPLMARKVGRFVTVRQVVPAAFVASLAVTGLLAPWVPAAGLLGLAIAGTYAAAVLGTAARAGPRIGLRAALALAIVFPVVHASYGLGFLRRLLAFALQPARRRFREPGDIPLSR
jgi:glycosyltransferase involved in cell wall biosynthesis